MSDSFDEVGAERTEKLWQRVARLEQELLLQAKVIRNLAECSAGLLELFENMEQQVEALVAVSVALAEAGEEAR